MEQLIAHIFGDYILQSDWMANNKNRAWSPAVVHGLFYTLPFVFLTRSPAALSFICISHILIDHTRLARYICYAKNFIGPRDSWHPWSKCDGTGYSNSMPLWMSLWLMIIADNGMHLLVNNLCLRWL